MKSKHGFLALFLMGLLMVTGCNHFQGADLTPHDLRCEYLQNPLGIENPTPALSWKLFSKKHNQIQTAYQVLVSFSKDNLEQNIGDLWDTGKVNSDKNVFISYAGQKISSGERAFYKVRVWDRKDGPSQWSEIHYWEMGLVNSSDWEASWIGQGEDQNPDSFETGPAPYFRKEFTLKENIKSARVYVSGLGYYELYLNGQKVSDNVLVPAQTNYDKRELQNLIYHYDDQSTTRVLYNTYDVTDLVSDGANTAGIVLGHGWYNQRSRPVEGWMWYNLPRLILQLDVEYLNGERQTITSDNSWKVSTGPIVYNQIFTGEIYDARLELDGWAKAGFDESAWNNAKTVKPPTGKLEPQLAPPDKVVKTLRPVSVTNPQKGVYLYDVGQMISGWARLHVKGSPGDTVSLRFIEELGSDYRQKDIYILKGENVETYEPRFTWHAFRHVEVSGLKTELTLNDLEAVVVNTAVNTVGSFECSNDLFNKIYRNYIWTQLGNFHGSFSSDCPHRERLGYTGDGQLLVESSIFNFDMTQFYQKWINDMNDARNKNTGYVPHTAPFGGGGGGPAWGSSYVIVPWFYYLYYGDKNVLRQHYDGMKQWVEYLGTRTDENGIVVREEPNGWCLGDWAPPARIELPEPLVNTCFYFYCADIMSKIADVLKDTDDKNYFDNLKTTIKTALNEKYLDKSENRYWTSYQGADVFPLAFGVVPEERRDNVFQSLLNHVDKNKGHLDTGILATPLLLEVLTEMGRKDLAFSIMNQRDFPSFGHYILGKGATTLWEEWDGRGSHSHPMYGSVIRWFYKALAGFNPDPKQPGFKHIIFKPTPCGDLEFAKASYNSLYGPIASDWKTNKDDFTLNIDIPANTTATVFVPTTDENKVRFDKNVGVKFIRFENNRAIYSVGSGKFQFKSKGISELVGPVRLPTPIITGGKTLYHNSNNADITITASNDADIFYTTDGTEPDENSNRYSGPIQINKQTILKTRAYSKKFSPSYVVTEKIRFIDPVKNGLKYTVFEGSWKDRPELNNITAVSTGRTYEFDVNKIPRRGDWVAVSFEGFFDIVNSGEYTFYASANNGCVVYVDDKIVVDNAGYTGGPATQGKINLTNGRHSLKVFYYENDGTESMDFEIEGPGIERQPFPPEMVFHSKGGI